MIPFLDLKKVNARFKNQYNNWFSTFLESGQYILGAAVAQFEKEFATYCGAPLCVGVGNGLDALRLIFEAYIVLGRLQVGDKVLICAHSYIATALAVKQAGLVPLFAEAEKKHFNFDIKKLNELDDPALKAIIVTHLYGEIGPMEALSAFAKAKKCLLIEDAAQAHGAELNGKKAGSLGDAAAFSFYPTKNLGALGDGGAVTTTDQKLAVTVKKLRNYGASSKYENDLAGFNSRLDPLQAGFLSIKLKVLDADNQRRRQIAQRYFYELNNSLIKLPVYEESLNHVFHIFPVLVSNRAEFLEYLGEEEIGFLIHYPIPPHKQKALSAYNSLFFPVAEELASQLVSLPISPVMTDADVQQVITVINRFS